MKMKSGFTLIELMVVIAIIAILGVMITPQITRAMDKAKAAKIVALADTFRTAGEMYRHDLGGFGLEYAAPGYTGPANHQLSMNPGGATAWNGPYLRTPLTTGQNPFGNHFLGVYRSLSVWPSGAGGIGFDLDMNGTVDTTGNGNQALFGGVSQWVRQLVNGIIDGVEGGWQTRGQVEDFGNNYWLTIFLIRE